jgi:hypothetical protein
MVLPDATTVAADLAHVLWIGGAPDAGKTTISRAHLDLMSQHIIVGRASLPMPQPLHTKTSA